MNKIQKVFEKGPAFVGYLTAGQRGLDYSLHAALALVDGGVDILEIGVPFSDPVADGIVIQEAMLDALKKNVSIMDVLQLIKKIRNHSSIPIILFSYYNPILQAESTLNTSRFSELAQVDPSSLGIPLGAEERTTGVYMDINEDCERRRQQRGKPKCEGSNIFFQQAKDAGVDGILIVDLPLEESAEYTLKCAKFKIAPIFVIAPSAKPERIKTISKKAQGFLYYACRKGTTGMKNDLPDNFSNQIQLIKGQCKLPVVAGFGVSSKKIAKEIISSADGFVVGSLFVDAIQKGMSPEQLKQLAITIDPRKVQS